MIGKTLAAAVLAVLLAAPLFLTFDGGGGTAFGQVGVPTNSLWPGPPGHVRATAGDGMATVSFAPPKTDGGSQILYYTVMSHPGGSTVKGMRSPLVVEGLTNGKTYVFTVTASNSVGTGRPSEPSECVTPGPE